MLRATMLFGLAIWTGSLGAQAFRLDRPEPATRPAFGKPVTEPAKIREAFVGLMSPDPVQRGKAREDLLRLDYQDLPTLAAVARQFKPLPATLVSMLKPIVIQVHATGEPYEQDSAGFLGITMPNERPDPDAGILVETRMLGFVGASVLEDGDLILDLEERPLVQHRKLESFQEAIRATKPGETVHLKVLRRGQVVRVAAKLSGRPMDKTGGNLMEYRAQVEELINRRNRKAEAYWGETFEPLTGDGPANAAAMTR